MTTIFSPQKDGKEGKHEETYNEMLQSLPKDEGWLNIEIVQYQGYWVNPRRILKSVILLQNQFKARETDIILGAFMKCGNTWLKTLMFATMNRHIYDLSNHPILNTGPHDCFPYLETHVSQDSGFADLEALLSPRLLSTHIPYALLGKHIAASGCKFIHIWRDPKDVLISNWHFTNKIRRSRQLEERSLEEAFELFCNGICDFGPLWDHVLGYWKASLEIPESVLILRYEDLRKEPVFYLKRLAEFMGKPFTTDEETKGVVEGIVKLCSFENLRNLEINKNGVQNFSEIIKIDNRNFFRKGEVGDFRNHLTDEMIKRLDNITQEKFGASGLI